MQKKKINVGKSGKKLLVKTEIEPETDLELIKADIATITPTISNMEEKINNLNNTPTFTKVDEPVSPTQADEAFKKTDDPSLT